MRRPRPLRAALITGVAAGIAWSQWEARAFIETNRFRRGTWGFIETAAALLPYHILTATAVALFAAAVSLLFIKIGGKAPSVTLDLEVHGNALLSIAGLGAWATTGLSFYVFLTFFIIFQIVCNILWPWNGKRAASVAARLRWWHLPAAPALLWLIAWAGLPPPPQLPPPGEPPSRAYKTNLKVLLFALDGASWEFLRPGVENGVLPNFTKLVDTGASGPLKTQRPTSSPILWSTIATGKNPDKHGIEGWVVYRLKPFGARFLRIPQRSFVGKLNGHENRLTYMTPLTSNYRRCRALWNVLRDRDDKSLVIGWWVTWPAERIKGVMVTPYAWPFVDTVMTHENLPVANPPGSVYPESIMEKLKPLIVTSEEVKKATFMGVPAEAMAELYPQSDVYDLWYYAKDISFIKMARLLLTDHPDYTFASVYIEGIDMTQHVFLRYARPEWFKGKRRPSEKEKLVLGPIISNYYKWVDWHIGKLLSYADENTVVAVVSDHGVEAGWRNMHYSGDHIHAPPGVLILNGGPIRKGAKIASASIEDVAPTLLYLLGYPVGDDMDGKVVTEAIDERFIEKFPVRTVPTLDGGFQWGGTTGGSAYDRRLIEKLKAIGYL